MDHETHGSAWVESVRRIGPALGEVGARHDLEGTFVRESYALLKEHRFFSMRAEQLSVADFVELTNWVAENK